MELDTLVRTAAAWGIATDLDPPATPVAPEAWPGLVARATGERVIGTLAAAVRDGAWAVDEHQARELRDRHRAWMGAALRLERRLLTTADDFAAAGIRFLVLKGPAAAHLDYADPADRCFGDIDLLIPPAHLEAARDLLVAQGGRRHYREPRPGFDRRFTKGLSITMPDDLEVDVHRTLAAGPFGLALDLDRIHDAPDRVLIGGMAVPALGRPQRFLHACYHAVLGSAEPRLVPLRDLAQIAEAGAGHREPLALDAVLDLARASRGEAVVAAAIRAATDRLGWRAPHELVAWAHARVDDRREQRWLAGYRGAGRAYATQAVTALEAVPGWRDKAAYLLAVTLPEEASHGDARRARWHRGLTALRRTARSATRAQSVQ